MSVAGLSLETAMRRIWEAVRRRGVWGREGYAQALTICSRRRHGTIYSQGFRQAALIVEDLFAFPRPLLGVWLERDPWVMSVGTSVVMVQPYGMSILGIKERIVILKPALKSQRTVRVSGLRNTSFRYTRPNIGIGRKNHQSPKPLAPCQRSYCVLGMLSAGG